MNPQGIFGARVLSSWAANGEGRCVQFWCGVAGDGDRETEQQEQSLGLPGKHSTNCKEPCSVVSFCNWEFVGNTESGSNKNIKQAWKHFQAGTMERIYDPNLMVEGDGSMKEEILRVVQIGLLCTQESASLRPTMSKVLQMLMKKEEKLPAPTNPPFMDERTMELNDTSEDPSYFNMTEASSSAATVTHSSFHPR